MLLLLRCLYSLHLVLIIFLYLFFIDAVHFFLTEPPFSCPWLFQTSWSPDMSWSSKYGVSVHQVLLNMLDKLTTTPRPDCQQDIMDIADGKVMAHDEWTSRGQIENLDAWVTGPYNKNWMGQVLGNYNCSTSCNEFELSVKFVLQYFVEADVPSNPVPW